MSLGGNTRLDYQHLWLYSKLRLKKAQNQKAYWTLLDAKANVNLYLKCREYHFAEANSSQYVQLRLFIDLVSHKVGVSL